MSACAHRQRRNTESTNQQEASLETLKAKSRISRTSVAKQRSPNLAFESGTQRISQQASIYAMTGEEAAGKSQGLYESGYCAQGKSLVSQETIDPEKKKVGPLPVR